MKMEEDIITLKNVGRHYQMGSSTIKALDEVSVSVKKKDFILIIGPSGSGKSTMMNMIGALDYPTKGEIYLEGQNICELPESELAQIRGSKVGFVFQTFNLIPTLTALENIALPMIFHGVARDERISSAEKIMPDMR